MQTTLPFSRLIPVSFSSCAQLLTLEMEGWEKVVLVERLINRRTHIQYVRLIKAHQKPGQYMNHQLTTKEIVNCLFTGRFVDHVNANIPLKHTCTEKIIIQLISETDQSRVTFQFQGTDRFICLREK